MAGRPGRACHRPCATVARMPARWESSGSGLRAVGTNGTSRDRYAAVHRARTGTDPPTALRGLNRAGRRVGGPSARGRAPPAPARDRGTRREGAGLGSAARRHERQPRDLLSQGDLCLFYTEGHFPVCGRVSAKAHSPAVARAIWGTREDDGRTWEYMWFFDDMIPVNASSETVRIALGRAENARFQNFTHVSPGAEAGLRSPVRQHRRLHRNHIAVDGGLGVRPRFAEERPPPTSRQGAEPANPEETQAKREKANADHHAILVALSRALRASAAPGSGRCRTRSTWKRDAPTAYA